MKLILLRTVSCLILLALSLGATAQSTVNQPPLTPAQLQTFLARAGFDATAAELQRYTGLSQPQLAARLVAEAASNTTTVPTPDWLSTPAVSLETRGKLSPEERMVYRSKQNAQTLALREWWLSQMLATPTPLRERMVLFWHNHFPSSQQKVIDAHSVAAQHAVMRAHALGEFGSLLKGVVESPAMLVYLDALQNRAQSPNENLARELMELFTLGEGRYSEADVKGAARALTGWGINPSTGLFQLNPRQHDTLPKTVLGKQIDTGDDLLALLLSRPDTARWIVGKLWAEFVSPTIEPQRLDALARSFYAQRYDIAALMRDILSAPELLAPENQASLVKSPVELLVGTLRRFEVPVADPRPLLAPLNAMGQVLFMHPSVKGWATGTGWINANTLLARKSAVAGLFAAPRVVNTGGSTMGEMMGAMNPSGQGRANQGNPQSNQQGAPNAATVPPMMGRATSLSVDPIAWLTRQNLPPHNTLNAEQRSALSIAVLHTAPVVPLDSSAEGLPALRTLLADIAYQVK